MRAGSWLIEAELGRGGMGVVYAVRHVQIGKRAALKILHRKVREPKLSGARMVQEAQVVNAIGHPNIIDIFDVGTLADGRPYIVMERLEGVSLGDCAPDLDETLGILVQVCDALIAAHAAGVVHRDLKPDNIFLLDGVDGERRVKLLDWGIARVLHVDGKLTLQGQLIGTPRYLAPEQARGEPVTPQSDVYSLGVVAYEMLLEQAPFDADTPNELMAMHLLVAPPPPHEHWPTIPPRLERLLQHMLAKAPDARPTMTNVAHELAQLRDERTQAPPVLEQPRRRWPVIVSGAIAAIAAIVALVPSRSPLAAMQAQLVAQPAAEPKPLVNPVLEDCADPSVLRDGRRWYMTCTGGRDGNTYPIFASSDLQTWQRLGWIFPAGQRPAWAAGNFWSPELQRSRDGFTAYFSMRATGGKNAIGVATAPTAIGPYTSEAPLLAPREGASDAHVLVDGDRRYLYFKREGKPSSIWVKPLDDRDARAVLVADAAWERDNVEAPAVLRHGAYYYLFYSGNRYCDAGYAVGVARARSPLGPFEKLAAPVVASLGAWVGPGHPSIVEGPAGERYLAYHAYRRADGTPSCDGSKQRRHVRIDPLRFDGGWPLVELEDLPRS